MIKLALTAATTAAFLCSGSALTANAQDRTANGNHQYAPAPVIGEAGAHWANQCWVETWGSGSSYFGYWQPCAPAAPQPPARR